MSSGASVDMNQVHSWPLGGRVFFEGYPFSLLRPVITCYDTFVPEIRCFIGTMIEQSNSSDFTAVHSASLCNLSVQGAPSKKSEPPKKAQMIEPVLRHAPQRRAVPQTTAAHLRTARADSDAPDSKRPKLDHSASFSHPSHPSRNSPEDKQQQLYKQQIHDALRDASPDRRIDLGTAQQQSRKRPTSRMAPQRQRQVSPAVQDLTDR